MIAAVWIDPSGPDAELVFATNRQATAGALAMGHAGLPAAAAVVAQRDAAWNPFFRTP